MTKEENIQIYHTAFLISTFRSIDEVLSQDIYAKLWNSEANDKWIKQYLHEVSSEEVYTHCLRNRYFLDTIKGAIQNHNVEVLINFGCGFSMYPYLIEDEITHIEIDRAEVLAFKDSKIKEWQEQEIVPSKKVHRIEVDFSKDFQTNLKEKINAIKGNKSCYILIEGVLFFLEREETNQLFSFFNEIQKVGDFIGSASFQDKQRETTAYKNLITFLNKNITDTDKKDYQTIPDKYYHELENYKVIDHQDYFKLSKVHNNKVKLPKDLILNENFYLLEKRNN